MTWFSLPATQANNTAAFSDAESAASWLAGRPLANPAAMLALLTAQIEALNRCVIAPADRFAALETLRPSVFSVAAELRRRFEYRPLPLSSIEQSALDGVCRLWRSAAQGYLHCLRACLEQQAASTPRAAEVTHRVLSCLRMEQLCCYVAASELADDFWTLLHAVWASAEQLCCTRLAVSDRLLGETRDSTVAGQYAMALLLHLARPFALSRGQFAAACRWLARWRELADVLAVGDGDPASRAIDLLGAQPLGDPAENPGATRWLSLRGVLRKLRGRVDALAAGQTPESLKLGSALSAQECSALLGVLDDRLKHPPQSGECVGDGEPVVVAVGLENCFRQIGGVLPDDSAKPSTSPSASQLLVEQIAVFGHVVRSAQSGARASEIWRLVAHGTQRLQLTRAAGSGCARLVLRGLLAVRLPRREDFVLASVSGVRARRDGRLCVDARLLPGCPTPLLAEVRDRRSAIVSRHAAIYLASKAAAMPPLVFVGAGLAQQAQTMLFRDAYGEALPDLRLEKCLARCGDAERWSVAV